MEFKDIQHSNSLEKIKIHQKIIMDKDKLKESLILF